MIKDGLRIHIMMMNGKRLEFPLPGRRKVFMDITVMPGTGNTSHFLKELLIG